LFNSNFTFELIYESSIYKRFAKIRAKVEIMTAGLPNATKNTTKQFTSKQHYQYPTQHFLWTPAHILWGGFNTATEDNNHNLPYPAVEPSEPSEPPRKKIRPNTQEGEGPNTNSMVENGASSGELEDTSAITGSEFQTDGTISKDAKRNTEMVRLIVQSLQHLGYGYELKRH
jgi:hypothetical protein